MRSTLLQPDMGAPRTLRIPQVGASTDQSGIEIRRLDSVYDIRVLFVLDGGYSDAEAMAELFLLPSWLWASAWMLMSLGMLGWTLWTTRAQA